jgi:hypothetical protein
MEELKPTQEQEMALLEVYSRQEMDISLDDFKASAEFLIGGGGCLMVQWCGMWLGIEPDGHTHS